MGFILGRVWTRYPVGELRSPMPYGLAKKKITTTKIIRRESGLKGLMRPSLFALPLPFSQRRQWHPSPGLLPGKPHGGRSLVAAVHGVAKSRMRLSDFTLTFHFHALERKWQPTRVLAWRIPGTGEPGGLPSVGSQSRTRRKRLSSSSFPFPGTYA